MSYVFEFDPEDSSFLPGEFLNRFIYAVQDTILVPVATDNPVKDAFLREDLYDGVVIMETQLKDFIYSHIHFPYAASVAVLICLSPILIVDSTCDPSNTVWHWMANTCSSSQYISANKEL